MSLEDLLEDAQTTGTQSVSDRELSTMLDPFVDVYTYQEDELDYRVTATSEFNTLSPRRQAIVTFLTVESLYRLDLRENRFIPYQELFAEFALDESVHYPQIRALEQDGILHRLSDGRYAIRVEQLRTALLEVKAEKQ